MNNTVLKNGIMTNEEKQRIFAAATTSKKKNKQIYLAPVLSFVFITSFLVIIGGYVYKELMFSNQHTHFKKVTDGSQFTTSKNSMKNQNLPKEKNSDGRTTNSTPSNQQTSNSNSGTTNTNSTSNQNSGTTKDKVTTDSKPIQTGITGDTKIINLFSPTANQMVKAGSKMTVTGTVAKGFENQTLQVKLFSGTQHGSKTLQVQTFQVGSDGHFSGTFTVPSSLPSSGTKMEMVLELLVKGGPQIQTTLTAE